MTLQIQEIQMMQKTKQNKLFKLVKTKDKEKTLKAKIKQKTQTFSTEEQNEDYGRFIVRKPWNQKDNEMKVSFKCF